MGPFDTDFSPPPITAATKKAILLASAQRAAELAEIYEKAGHVGGAMRQRITAAALVAQAEEIKL